MKPHEIIEMIITTVCSFYRVDWQRIYKPYRQQTRNEMNARKACIYYLSIYIGEKDTKDTMKCIKSSIEHAEYYCIRNRQEQKEIRQYLYEMIELKTAA